MGEDQSRPGGKDPNRSQPYRKFLSAADLSSPTPPTPRPPHAIQSLLPVAPDEDDSPREAYPDQSAVDTSSIVNVAAVPEPVEDSDSSYSHRDRRSATSLSSDAITTEHDRNTSQTFFSSKSVHAATMANPAVDNGIAVQPEDRPVIQSRGGGQVDLAKRSHKKVTSFGVDKEELIKLIEVYLTRKVGDEDLMLFDEIFGSTSGFCNALASDALDGLYDAGDEMVALRKKTFGKNILKQPAKRSFIDLWIEAAKDKMMVILIVAAIISLVVAIFFGEHPEVEWIEGFAILCSVFVVTTVTAGNDYAKEQQFRELQGSAVAYCTVVRNGQNITITTTELMVGDVILLEMGEEVPCDCIFTYSLGCDGLQIDESSMTGESDPSRKSVFEDAMRERDELGSLTSIHEASSPVLVSGTTVLDGSGCAMVVAVGTNSQIGINSAKLAMDTDTTPLQNKLSALADLIGWAGGAAALAIVLSLTIQFWILWAMGDRTESTVWIFQQHLKFFTEAITIIVVAVPEGLPLAVTISLAYSVQKMLEDQNYVRKLAACEIMGGATDICSDKTGTLTMNKMNVNAFWNSSTLVLDIKPPVKKDKIILYDDPHLSALWQTIAINSTAALTIEENGTIKHVGNASECALLEFAYHLGVNRESTRAQYMGATLEKLIRQVPFTSVRKSMTTVIISPDDPTKYRVMVKGAAEISIHQCDWRVDSANTVRAFTAEHREQVIFKIIKMMASCALRTLCLAYKDFDPQEMPDWAEKNDKGIMNCERELICLGIFGIQDIVREQVPGAVKRMQKSGVTVRMVTGDNIDAAKTIGAHCNIYRPQEGGIAMLGPEFTSLVEGVVCKWCRTAICDCALNKDDLYRDQHRRLSCSSSSDDRGTTRGCCRKKKKTGGDDESIPPPNKRIRVDVVGNLDEMRRLEPKLQILARSQPQDKYTLVVGLRQLRKVVCVTGDGANDAPALKMADVGMAMGLTGKDAAKEASDVVLLDDNFYGIVRACVWGRNIYENIARFLQFQLTVNVVAVLLSFITAFLLRSAALTTVQLLWLNMIMDTLAALALATDDPSDELLDRPPVSRDQGLVTKVMWKAIISNSIYQMIVACTIVFCGECWIPEKPWLSDVEMTYIQNGGRAGYCDPGTLNADGVDQCLIDWPAYPNYAQYHSGENDTCNWVGGQKTVVIGRAYHIFSEETDYPENWIYDARIGASRHYTVLFNTFVFMQIANLLLSRRLGNDLNVFSGIWTNKIWIGVFVGATLLQAIFCTFGNIPFSVHPEGLTGAQWGISLALGIGMLPWGLAVRLLPQKGTDAIVPPEIGKTETDPLSADRLGTLLRASSTRLSSRMLIAPRNESTTLRRKVTIKKHL